MCLDSDEALRHNFIILFRLSSQYEAWLHVKEKRVAPFLTLDRPINDLQTYNNVQYKFHYCLQILSEIFSCKVCSTKLIKMGGRCASHDSRLIRTQTYIFSW
jgi:hypothetical protein